MNPCRTKLPELKEFRELVKKALAEDIGPGDITTEAIIEPGIETVAEIIAKENGIVGGLFAAEEVFRLLDKNIKFRRLAREGEKVKKYERIASIRGDAGAILKGERAALNFMQRISGIATETFRCVEKLKSSKTYILDTRKTPAGFRPLDKYAVRLGGGKNHRLGLYDTVLIKDNHIALCGGVREAIKKARKKYPAKKIEIEAKNFKELRDALESGVDIVMLDNMSLKKIEKAVGMIKGRCRIEVSGNVPFSRITRLAKLGVDYISLGRLTHSPRALDLSLRIKT